MYNKNQNSALNQNCIKLITSLEVEGKVIKNQNNIAKAQKQFYQYLYSENSI